MNTKRIDAACAFIVNVANDPAHGYTQGPGRCGPVDYDCSGLAATAYNKGGYPVVIGYDTASIGAELERVGFRRRPYVPGTLKKGSAEVRPKTSTRSGHIAICVDADNQTIAEAYSNEFGGITGGKPGDQTGGEIRLHSDWQFGTYIYDPPEYFEPEKPKPTVGPKKGPDEEVPVAVTQGDVVRLYNPNNGDHVYTTSSSEAKNLVSSGWKNEGTIGVAPHGYAVLYRLYNVSSGQHLWTDNATEVNNLLKQGSNLSDGTKNGWQYEGESMIVYSDGRGSKRVHRLYNPYDGSHVLSVSDDEIKSLTKSGWKDEGVVFSLD